MISAFDGFLKIKHDNIIVLYFAKHKSGYRITYTLPGRVEHFSLYLERTDPYDNLSYIQINGKKYDCDNIEKNYEKIQMLITQETNRQAIEALP